MDIKKEFKKAIEAKEVLKKKDLKDKVDTGDKLSAMTGSPGWKLVEDYLTREMEISMNALLASKVDRDIYYHQAVVAVIRKLLAEIGVSFQLATDARETLKEYK